MWSIYSATKELNNIDFWLTRRISRDRSLMNFAPPATRVGSGELSGHRPLRQASGDRPKFRGGRARYGDSTSQQQLLTVEFSPGLGRRKPPPHAPGGRGFSAVW